MKILRSSRSNGSFQGNDELFLFCDQFDPNDVKVEFFQLKNDTDISWRAFAQIDPTDIHHNCALTLKTPPYVTESEGKLKSITLFLIYYFNLLNCIRKIPC